MYSRVTNKITNIPQQDPEAGQFIAPYTKDQNSFKDNAML
jgi:hypothetical protein